MSPPKYRETWEEDTRPDLLRPSLKMHAASASPPADDDSTLGMLMRQTVNNTQSVQALRLDFDVLAREVRQSNRAQPDIVSSSAARASNRLAVLMGSLFTLYEISAPYLREFWRQVVNHR